MQDIILTTLNSSYFHTAFGLRYLFANMGELQSRTLVKEFTIKENPRDIAEHLLSLKPKIIGLGVYIWNTRATLDVVSIIKKIAPQVRIVLGGPEISYETEGQELFTLCDAVIPGEGDFLFRSYCERVLQNDIPQEKIFRGELPEIQDIVLPYSLYTEEDIKNRVIYVEASRGCPYKCEFCLSSLDKTVRTFEMETFLGEMRSLIERGARQFKFVDRTFNLNFAFSRSILLFFLKHINKGLFLHFELVPDRLPQELKDLIVQFPKGSLQFEIGVQTWNPEVAKRISRLQNYEKVVENFQFLREHTHVHLHADLIAGLPGETLESFGKGFDALANLNPHEIQVGILKRLKGTPIIRHDREWEMRYESAPAFPILSTKTMPFETLQTVQRFAKFWDLYANSGNFSVAMELLKSIAKQRKDSSLFSEMLEFTAFLSKRHPERHSLALLTLVESFYLYLVEVKGIEKSTARNALIEDYAIRGRRDIPKFLRTEEEGRGQVRPLATAPFLHTPNRQQRHGAGEYTAIQK